MTPIGRTGHRDALRTLLVVLLVGAVAFGANLVIALTVRDVSLFDEGVHFDYVVKLHDGIWPDTAAQVSPQTIHELGCRGAVWLPDASCGDLTRAQVPNHAANYVLSYPPTFYAYASAVGWALAPFGISLFEAGRIAGVLLFAVGTALMAWGLIRLGVSRWMAAAASTFMVLLTLGYRLGSTVSPDSAFPLVGAATLLVLTIPGRWRTRLAIATAIGVAIAVTKPSFVPSACLVALVAALGAPIIERGTLRRWWDLGRRRWIASAVAVVVPVIVAIAWQLFRLTQLAPGETEADGGLNRQLLYTSKGLPQVIVDGLIDMSNPFGNPLIPHVSTYWAPVFLVANAVFFCGVGLVAVWYGRSLPIAARVLGLAGVIGYVATAAYTAGTMWISFHSEGVQPRYTMPLTPIFIAAIAVAVIPVFRRRWMAIAFSVVSAVLVIGLLADAVGVRSLLSTAG